MHKKILEISSTQREWDEGFIRAEDTQCFVTCNCGEELSVSDYKIFECPKCGRGYITEFSCYRIPAEALRLLAQRAEDAPTACAHLITEPIFVNLEHCYVCGVTVRR